MRIDDKLLRAVNSTKIVIDNQVNIVKEYPDGTREKIGGKDISKVSELENDANYQNAEQVNSAIDEATSTLATKDELNGKADKSEIPTVNNAKITITQGGAEKGSFTLNQANEDTIEIDAGGGGGDTVNYLTFTAEEAGATIALDKSADNPSLSAVLEYDLGDDNWQNYTWDVTSGLVITLANIGDKVRFRGDNEFLADPNDSYVNTKYTFKISKKIAASGSIMTLLDKTDKLRDLTGKRHCFAKLFFGCYNLTSAPELPATKLARRCYYEMFWDCRSLTQAPELPATTLDMQCCEEMFNGCKGLTQAPALPATTLAEGCYNRMFFQCTSLTKAPELPATTLARSCYSDMFRYCSNLTKAPALPATTLTEWCYSNMFYGCTNLTSAPELPATTLASSCYSYMFKYCSNLNYISITYTGADNPGAFNNWLGDVPGPGYFVCPEGFPVEQIPAGWEVSHVMDDGINRALAKRVAGSKIGMTIWTGTQQEYDGLTTKDANTLYMIKEA